MGFQNLQGKQLRGKRTRDGKLIRNKIGGYERSRGCDDYYGTSRRRLMLEELERQISSDCCEATLACSDENLCRLTGESICAGGGQVLGELDNGNYCLAPDRYIVLRYGQSGKLSSAHIVGYDEACGLID